MTIEPFRSLPGQIVEDLRTRITAGTLRPGDPLPSTRVLARQRGISRGSVVAAYDQLSGEGYLVATRGGTRVNPELPRPPRPEHPAPGVPARPRLLGDLRPGVPDTALLASTLWRRAWRAAAAEPVAYPGQGSPRLRRLLAEHLRMTRSVAVSPEQIVVTLGARDGLRLILMATEGVVAVEDPGYPTLHQVPRNLGREVVPVPVDEEGLSVSRLAELAPEVVLVMPNHQYPTGSQMSAARRFELIEWSRRSGAILVEDDYDSELRPTHPALAALDPQGSVALLGSLAKTLTPALGLGYLVVPERLHDDVARHMLPVSGIVQDAIANFLENDGMRRHTARMGREYRRRREIFAEIFPRGIPMNGGLHAVIELGEDEDEVIARCRTRGLAVEGLSRYWTASDRPGIVIGLGAHNREKLREVLVELRRVLGT
ncbi:MocR-like pyridoxine biosynthesis transcription factor PdxR [Corynebacterium comes]|uniref:HTH-type transcriptional regulatory protein GabR n=1 Tax=Corynebacterium comes TaxID=2675218 RepID=A0A6B8VYQ4_9CORY|nr:PLP-dependent aminotransferase family protein [Corynebacterium comes]QGU05321.1 HTH-type transcriptional regulatory protein GabR [Corynebacterium comes]